MRSNLLLGVAAGAVGTVALNAATYLDMAVRARPSSSMPNKAVETIAEKAGVDLTPKGGDEEAAQNRTTGLGALVGYVTGLGVGLAYGIVRPRLGKVSTPLAGVGLGLAAMAGSDGPMTALGLTDPREWDATSWASDIIPHLAYGLATAAAYETFNGGS